HSVRRAAVGARGLLRDRARAGRRGDGLVRACARSLWRRRAQGVAARRTHAGSRGMKIEIIGGGPGGLYFALLMKKRFPDYDVTVHERNRADDTFGFGVVFSDETLDNLMDYDAESYAAITREFSYWDEIDFHFHREVVRSTGHGFCGTERR